MQQAITIFFLFFLKTVSAQPNSFPSVVMYGDVRISIDSLKPYRAKKETLVILYALPNGNTTEQTMGKRMAEGDDWHFDIQHIKAQTKFIREQLPDRNIIVVYLENNYKSWPLWKSRHPAYKEEVRHIVDSLFESVPGKKWLYLNGHSGGGRFIFSYLEAVDVIPGYVRNIGFLDSNYGYDSTYLPKISAWLKENKDARLNVFAYNDSVALLNGKRFVSDTGGTWYRSGLMLRQMNPQFSFTKKRDDSLLVYYSVDRKIRFYLKTNPEQKIFHTQQVELNGFIHSVLIGSKREEKAYKYFAQRAYEKFID